ncbi:hypothetical protein RA263_22945 [Pseudomonas syringae pv. tagetis]|uniref:Uncharacterized protein n=1 Tax=Pseudomonas syringae pv. tagetis TaxID=129140 RepID=A0A0N8T2V9_9PSED|nr:hypothetical protein [Pseudomonas syringae group genomosp. 7]KPY83880.1 Unknown protein sequence [Pseudomonas syringae pv. tagetis]RMW15805.1 hypothetical protein ALO98_01049 [Pseudomonas syringae pv. tagetis]RMW18329.1 hypothetical protein ALO97_01181 [Pseudomonas syringae pv. tagetis]UNB69496.1 hypothetical protein MME58_04410 [Pseudomonas syringae pv. tagetis]
MMGTAETIRKTLTRLAELSNEIPAAQAAWKASLLGEGDPGELAKQKDSLTSEQVVEAARLEALEERLRSEQEAADDFEQQRNAKAANAIVSEHAAWVQQLKDKAGEFLAIINSAPSTDTFYTLALGASKHLEAINVASVPDFYADAVKLKHALDKTIDRVARPARVVASIRNARISLQMKTAASPAPVLL